MSDIEQTLEQRGNTYGEYKDNARITCLIMDILKAGTNYKALQPIHECSLMVIAQKMARIVNGDPNHKDNWHDIQGYAKLTEDRCL